MLLVGLNGSPNKNGNTKELLKKIMEKARSMGGETAIIDVGDAVGSVSIPFCNVCVNPCTGQCYKGTKLEEAFELMKKADGIVFGSPVYFGSMSGQLKAMFDKSRKLRAEKAFYNTIGAGVTVAAAKYGGQETAMKALHDIMLVHGMIIVGDGFKDDDCGHHGVSAQRPSADDDYAAKRADILAKRLVEVCKATESLRKELRKQ